MKTIQIIVMAVLLFALANTVSAEEWLADPAIVTGLEEHTVVYPNYARIFNDSGTLKAFINSDGTYTKWNAFRWSGSEWIMDNSMVNGLNGRADTNGGSMSFCYHQGVLSLITLDSMSIDWNAFRWVNGVWVTNPAWVNGLEFAGMAHVVLYDQSGDLNIIVHDQDGILKGYTFDGATWSINPEIITGLNPTTKSGGLSIYEEDGARKIVVTERDFSSSNPHWVYTWNGASWISDDSGIAAFGVENTLVHDVYFDDGPKIVGSRFSQFVGGPKIVDSSFSRFVGYIYGFVENLL